MKTQDTTKSRDTGAIAAVWRFFSSVRLAFFLMLIIVGLSLVGALLIQVPAGIASNPQDYAAWVETAAADKVGGWATLLSWLKLFDVFHSPWFLGAGTLLIINILVCSVDRWGAMRLKMAGGPVKQGDAFYPAGNNRADLPRVPGQAAKVAAIPIEILRKRRFRVRTEESDGKVYVVGDKNRYYRLGTYVSHLSLILFITGFIIGSYWGFNVPSFDVPEGTTRTVGYETGLSLQLNSFVDEYYPDGRPSDYRSDVVLYKDGQEVKQGIIRVNHPMIYEGIRFYQSSFGRAAMLQVRGSDNVTIYKDALPLSDVLQGKQYTRYAGSFALSQSGGLQVYVVSSAVNAPDPMIPKGQVAVEIYHGGAQSPIAMDLLQAGVPKKLIGGLEFTFLKDVQYSGFQVNHDPGNALIWIASTLFILGITMVLYFPHRQVWALVQPRPDGGSRLLLRSTAPRNLGVAAELEDLVKTIRRGLKAR